MFVVLFNLESENHMGPVEYILTVIYLVAFPAWVVIGCLKSIAVSGILKEYVYKSLYIVMCGLIAVTGVARAAIIATSGEYAMAGFALFTTLPFSFWMIEEIKNGDNWFNDQWKKLKKGFKKLREHKLSLRLPRLSAA